jgi:hypothetical protein
MALKKPSVFPGYYNDTTGNKIEGVGVQLDIEMPE